MGVVGWVGVVGDSVFVVALGIGIFGHCVVVSGCLSWCDMVGFVGLVYVCVGCCVWVMVGLGLVMVGGVG